MLFFQIPQLDAHRLWYQVSWGPRRAGWSFLDSIYHTACLMKNTDGKRHHTEEFKERIAEKATESISSTIQCLQRKLCQNSNHYTMDHNRSVKYKLTERLGVQKPVWRTKADFLALFVFKGWLGPRVGPWGLAHFSQTRNKGFMWGTGPQQWTNWPP